MLRVTDDILELRTWAVERGGRPGRLPDGRLTLGFGAAEGGALPIDWGEFEVAFVGSRRVFVYDDAPDFTRCFVGTADEAREYVRQSDPRLTGEAPMHPSPW
jgi:hypothetical protein